ncbi:DUF1643 domain-containing protein [Thermocoleostomius sinensis]|uniref:DUF1643 domain-containing protein n=1 Tax=Thermocoleostomius sinensis A174 TaxID=2016057 RepID=A0A9E8ZCF1_9CYAN|nr:DUF1643 domain-containing protein [Thermocoleostomius sinensis]WAL58838.1 DUF1643 domain-containing protein [Thermocoleostomius sinensis A174]
MLKSQVIQNQDIQGGAIFDQDHRYRYLLWRTWELAAPRLAFVMLNPSTADAHTNDPTIRRCISFAQSWGYGSLEVVNLFARMATHPRQLQQVTDPVGVECDRHLIGAISRADRVILAWGKGGSLYQRDRSVLQLLTHHRANHCVVPPLYCLGVTQNGQPRHPLYLRRNTQLSPFPLSIPDFCNKTSFCS